MIIDLGRGWDMNKLFIFSILFSFQIYAQPKAIVIGASSGIGKAIVQELLEHDYVVGITARRVELLQELQVQYEPGRVVTHFMDVSKADESREAFIELVATLGEVDLVIINAGIAPSLPTDFTPEGEIAWEGEQRTIEVNVSGFVALANQAIEYFMKQGRGHLVGISSVDALRGSAACPVYCASKSFMSTYLEGQRNRFIQNNIAIDVTEIRPGFVETEKFKPGPSAYWVAQPDEVARQIYESIGNKEKVAYVTRRWRLIGLLLAAVPDWLYNKIGGF